MFTWQRASKFAGITLAAIVLAACGTDTATPNTPPPTTAAGGSPTATAANTAPTATTPATAATLRYALWDNNQVPGYQACADAFHTANPNITIKIEQAGWTDYWNNLQTQFVAKSAPDVFTDHMAYYPELQGKNLLLDLAPMVKADNVDLTQYTGALADTWVRDGKRYALPKDWDTVAIVYNADMFAKAGIDPSITNTWTWNAQDGGTYGQTIAKLTLDANGKNGLDPAFDKTKVVQYGLITSGGGGIAGQIEWSHYAMSNGAAPLVDKVFGTSYTYSDPKRVEAIQWYANLSLVKGFAPANADVAGGRQGNVFLAGKGAMVADGSWTVGSYVDGAKFKIGFGMLPIGPMGRKSMINGLGDSIYSGTTHPNEAWQWVKFLGSSACQDIIGTKGVVFPAIKTSVQKSLDARKAKGIDVSAFVNEAQDPKGTFGWPVSDHGSEIAAIIGPTEDSIMLGQSKAADGLKSADDQINALFK